MDVKWLAALACAACSGRGASKPRVEDAAVVKVPAPAPVVPTGPYKVDATFDKGDVQIRVEWKDVPVEARASGGRTACGTAKAPAVAPTTTWGIPDVVVMIEVNHGKASATATASATASASASESESASGSASGSGSGSASASGSGTGTGTGAGAMVTSRVVLEKCALSPRVAIVESPWIVASAMDAPAKVTIAKLGPARPLAVPAAPQTAKAATIFLPVAGHEAAVALDGNSIAELRSDDDSAIAVVAPTPYYAVTEANGQVVLKDVPVGTFDVAAWLPARAGQPSRAARGKVTVTAGGLAEVTLAL